MNQSECLANTCNLPKAREKPRVQGAIGFASHGMKNWGEIFKCSTRNRVNTFGSRLKTALTQISGQKPKRTLYSGSGRLFSCPGEIVVK